MKTNKYCSYDGRTFQYRYKYQWERRNKDYLKTIDYKIHKKDYIQPRVFRVRFYDDEGIICDDFYTSLRTPISFPIIHELDYWKFTYRGKEHHITHDHPFELIKAIEHGYDNVILEAVFKEEEE